MRDRIVFAGFVERSDLPQYFAACDVVAMGYRQEGLGDTEGFGIVLAEAGAAGKSAIAMRIGGTGDAIIDGETGYLFDEADEDGMVAALVRVLRDPSLRARLGAAGRARVERELNWNHAAGVVRAALHGVLACRADTSVSPTRA